MPLPQSAKFAGVRARRPGPLSTAFGLTDTGDPAISASAQAAAPRAPSSMTRACCGDEADCALAVCSWSRGPSLKFRGGGARRRVSGVRPWVIGIHVVGGGLLNTPRGLFSVVSSAAAQTPRGPKPNQLDWVSTLTGHRRILANPRPSECDSVTAPSHRASPTIQMHYIQCWFSELAADLRRNQAETGQFFMNAPESFDHRDLSNDGRKKNARGARDFVGHSISVLSRERAAGGAESSHCSCHRQCNLSRITRRWRRPPTTPDSSHRLCKRRGLT